MLCPPLYSQHAGDLARLHRALQLGAIFGEHQFGGVSRSEAAHHVNLFDRLLHCQLFIDIAGNIDRPILRPHTPGAQPPQIRVHHAALRVAVHVGGVVKVKIAQHIAHALAQRPGHIIMPVKNGGSLERSRRDGLGRRGCFLGADRGGDKGECGESAKQDGSGHADGIAQLGTKSSGKFAGKNPGRPPLTPTPIPPSLNS